MQMRIEVNGVNVAALIVLSVADADGCSVLQASARNICTILWAPLYLRVIRVRHEHYTLALTRTNGTIINC